MRICHVITGLQKAAGTTTFVENVVREQRALGYEVEVVTNANAADLAVCVGRASVVHIHGLWSPLLHKASRFARRAKLPVVWSTHGMTAPWALRHKWWKKCAPWYLYQRRDLKRAALIHCTTELEASWNQALGFERTFVVPLGTVLPGVERDGRVEVERCRGEKGVGRRVLLYVGRIYPVKALDNLIKAFALANETLGRKLQISNSKHQADSSWRLRLVGPDQAGHLAELVALCQRLGLTYSTPTEPRKDARVEFVGPKYDAELEAEYWACDALALVSHTENFGATVVDAMAHGKPVITSTRTPWEVVADEKCGWWVDNEPEKLAMAIGCLFAAAGPDLIQMGRRGRNLVERQYVWVAITRSLMPKYEGVLKERR